MSVPADIQHCEQYVSGLQRAKRSGIVYRCWRRGIDFRKSCGDQRKRAIAVQGEWICFGGSSWFPDIHYQLQKSNENDCDGVQTMAQSQFNKHMRKAASPPPPRRSHGGARGNLAIGLLSVAALFATTIRGTASTEYMTQAATLASEKLEDLNHYPSQTDPHVYVAPGGTAGSITTDASAKRDGKRQHYADLLLPRRSVFLPDAGKRFRDGQPTGRERKPAIFDDSESTEWHRSAEPNQHFTRCVDFGGDLHASSWRWVIEQDQPIAGVKRITVWVSLENLSIAPDVQFQMSIVRP